MILIYFNLKLKYLKLSELNHLIN